MALRRKRRAKEFESLKPWHLSYLFDDASFCENGFQRLSADDLRAGRKTGLASDTWEPEELWRTYSKEVLPDYIKRFPGTRPMPWWTYDAPEPLSENESQTDFLRRHDLLTSAEKKVL